jgi:hypothetical protein
VKERSVGLWFMLVVLLLVFVGVRTAVLSGILKEGQPRINTDFHELWVRELAVICGKIWFAAEVN